MTALHQHSPTDTTDAEKVRRSVHDMWDSVAGSWGKNADVVDARAPELVRRMLETTQLAAGDRVLELACGPGGLGLAAARLAAPGEVVVSDVAPQMVEVARERARTAGSTNVTFKVLDIEAIDEPDASFDVALCREGLMFAVDPARGAAEILRVLRPGGRAAIVVWGPRAENPWLGLPLDAVSAQIGRPVPSPGVPGPFSLDDAERFRTALTAGGFSDVSVERFSVPMLAPSFDAWWDRTTALAGPLARVVAAFPEDARVAVRDHARAAAQAYSDGDGVRFPGVALLASCRRP